MTNKSNDGKPTTDAEYHEGWIASLDGWIANHEASGNVDLAEKEKAERERHRRQLAKCAPAQTRLL